MSTCYILIGVPGSGKSTFIKDNYFKFPYNHGCEFPRPFPTGTDKYLDGIAEALEATYNDVFKNGYKLAEATMWRDIELCAADNQDMIIDRTNLTAKSRRKFIQALPDYRFEAIVFPVPENLEERLANRPGKTIPREAILDMVSHYEEPTLAEGFEVIWTPEQFKDHLNG